MDRIVTKISHPFFFLANRSTTKKHNKLNIFVGPTVFPRGVEATCKFRKVALFARPSNSVRLVGSRRSVNWGPTVGHFFAAIEMETLCFLPSTRNSSQ